VISREIAVDNLQAVLAELRQYLDKAPQRLAVFDYLWENQGRTVDAKELWDKVLKDRSFSDQQHSEPNAPHSNMRQTCTKLREKLIEFFTPERCWRWRRHIELPEGSRHVPYQLKVTELKDTPTMAFWRPHVIENNVNLVYVRPMFYLDVKTGCHLRFLDTNPTTDDPDKALLELEKQHPEELKKLYGSIDAARERLRPTHVYLGMGEVAALDALTKWFQKWPWVEVEKQANDSITSIQRTSPVLIGSQRSNKFIGGQLALDETVRFHYRLHDTDVFYVSIAEASEEEKGKLGEFFDLREEFQEAKNPLTKLPSRPPKTVPCTVAGSGMSLSVKRNRLVILTRMPNPESRNRTVTMITSDTTLAIQQVADALTDDEQLAPLLEALGWPSNPLPSCFEMLFSVEIAPGGVDNNTGPALLLAVRPPKPLTGFSPSVPPAP
jgi:hypothetical protein